MTHVARVMDDARDFSRRVDAKGEGALEGARARARSIERDEARLPLVTLAERPSPSVARVRQTASAQGKRPIDFLECRVVIFFAFIFC